MANQYINNSDFLKALIDFKNLTKENKQKGLNPPKIPNYIGECFLKIANNLAKRPNFCMYTYKDEMISDAIENCIMYFENFDPEKSNKPFAYFTQICWFAFVRRITKEKKQQYIKYKSTENSGIFDDLDDPDLNDSIINQPQIYDNLYEFIDKFENDFKEKKQLPKKVKGIEKFL